MVTDPPLKIIFVAGIHVLLPQVLERCHVRDVLFFFSSQTDAVITSNLQFPGRPVRLFFFLFAK